MPTQVLEWLGQDLYELLNTELTTYGAIDDLIQTLSNVRIRNILEGYADVHDAIEDPVGMLPAEILQVGNKDVRTLLKNRAITPNDFLKLVSLLTKPVSRFLPSWVGSMSDNIQIASLFTEEQLNKIESHVQKQATRYYEAELNAFLRIVSMQLDEALLIGTLTPAGFDYVLEKAQQAYDRGINIILGQAIPAEINNSSVAESKEETPSHDNEASYTDDVSPVVTMSHSSPTDESSQTESEFNSTVLTNQASSGAPQTPMKPSIPAQAYMVFALLMAARMYVAWYSTDNHSFAVKGLQSFLLLRGPENKTNDIAQSALLGMMGVFLYARGSSQPSTEEHKETHELNRTNPT